MTQLDDVRKGLIYLVNTDTGKTNEKNGQIIDKMDGEDAQYLIEQKDKWNAKQVQRALKICSKYRKELPKDLRGKIDKITIESIEREEQQIADFRERTITELKTKNDQENIGELFNAKDGSKIIFQQMKKFNPSQYFDDKAYFLTKLPYLKPLFNKEGKKIGETTALGLFLVTSEREVQLLNSHDLLKEKYILEEPDDIPDDRWSTDSIQRFLKGEEKIEPTSLFNSLVSSYEEYIDFARNVNASTIHSLYTVLTYCYRLFTAVPYLLMQGEMGSAKSKVGDIHEQLDFNAFKTVAVTGPNLYRTIKDTQGTVIQDENEKMTVKEKSENQLDIEAIVNSGYQASGKVQRLELVGHRNKRVLYPTYSPKILCSINNVTETIRDRSYVFIMIRTQDSKKANNNVSAFNPEWGKLRDGLMIFTLTYWKEIKTVISEGISNKANVNGKEIEVRGREWEKAFPLLVLARFFDKQNGNSDITNKVWEFLYDQKDKAIEISLDSFDQVVIDGLEQLIQEKSKSIDFKGEIGLKEIAGLIADKEGVNQTKKFNPRTYSSKIKKKLIYLDIGRDFRTGPHNYTVFESNLELINLARSRFNLNNEGESDNDETLINLISLINSISSFNSINTKIEGLRLNELNGVNRRLIDFLKTRDVSRIRIEAENSLKRLNELIKLIELNREMEVNHFNDVIQEVRSKDITINQEASKIDRENNRFLIYVLAPFRPDDKMKDCGFRFVNQSKDGFLYERPIDVGESQ
ncbi:MAG: hypothetical protein LVQ63_02525 [Thermoplasmatales archaeon]|nr:hypothetical protein [Thermoplasmatales archaeon]